MLLIFYCAYKIGKGGYPPCDKIYNLTREILSSLSFKSRKCSIVIYLPRSQGWHPKRSQFHCINLHSADRELVFLQGTCRGIAVEDIYTLFSWCSRTMADTTTSSKPCKDHHTRIFAFVRNDYCDLRVIDLWT